MLLEACNSVHSFDIICLYIYIYLSFLDSNIQLYDQQLHISLR